MVKSVAGEVYAVKPTVYIYLASLLALIARERGREGGKEGGGRNLCHFVTVTC